MTARTSILPTFSKTTIQDSLRSPGYSVTKNECTCNFAADKDIDSLSRMITGTSGTSQSANTAQLSDIFAWVLRLPQCNLPAQKRNCKDTKTFLSDCSRLLENSHGRGNQDYYHKDSHVVQIYYSGRYGHTDVKEATQIPPSWHSAYD